ncbi:NAD-dependent epimerase/dehydratase family protein [Magnetococcales bacterium HHB-1]
MPARFLITGGAGFVGSHLALALKQDYPQAEVIALDNLKRRGSELNVPRLKQAGVTFSHGDVRNPEDIKQVGAVDYLIECSAEPSVHAGYDGQPLYLVNTNLIGAIHCLEHLRKLGGKMIFLSTSRVYPIAALQALPLKPKQKRLVLEPESTPEGCCAEHGIAENFTLEGIRSLYGTTKLSAEMLISEYATMYDIPAVLNRCGVLAGPWQMGKVDQGFFALWLARHMFGGTLNYMGFGGGGLQVRDVLHVADLYTLVKQQIDTFDLFNQQTYNVGGGMKNSLSLQELTKMCQEITGQQIDIGQIPETKAADIPFYVTDHRKITKTSGWQPQHTLNALLSDTYQWIKKEEKQLKPLFLS